MERIETKHLIIGAGAMGAATAYHLARRGEPVLLIEQFALGHDRGSSHGAARITRHSYADARYARLMPAAFQAWRDLEADAGQPLYIRTGGVSFCDQGEDYVSRVAANLSEIGVPHRRFTGAEWNARQPGIRSTPFSRCRVRARRRHACRRQGRGTPDRACPLPWRSQDAGAGRHTCPRDRSGRRSTCRPAPTPT